MTDLVLSDAVRCTNISISREPGDDGLIVAVQDFRYANRAWAAINRKQIEDLVAFLQRQLVETYGAD